MEKRIKGNSKEGERTTKDPSAKEERRSVSERVGR